MLAALFYGREKKKTCIGKVHLKDKKEGESVFLFVYWEQTR